MKDRILGRLAALEPRVLLLLMASVLLVLALEGWLLVLRPPLTEYRRLQSERAELVRSPAEPAKLQAEAARLDGELAVLTRKLQGEGPQLAVDQLVVAIIEKLDRIAARRGIRLVSVRPGATRRVLMFDEVSADIQVSGKYEALFDWLREAEEELGPLAVTRFAMKSTEAASGALTMDLKLAAYRPASSEARKP